MKAAKLKRYGSPLDLEIGDAAKPSPGEGEVLVQVHASSVNDWDLCMIRGSPFYIRLFCGLFSPKVEIPGVDVSGVVEAIGSQVKDLRPGDAVYGDLSECGFGGFGEYVCVPETSLALKPASIDFPSAAAVPHAATLALQGLRDAGQLKSTTRLLINGAGGGVGTIGLQFARSMGVEHVTGVDHGRKREMMRLLGFDEVIDYTQVDFTATGERYDLILDTKTNRSPLRYLRALKSQGAYVTVGGTIFRILQILLLGPVIRLFSRKRIALVALKTNQDLDFISTLLDSGKIVPVTEGPTSLDRLPEAIQRFGEGRHEGKIVVAVKDDDRSGGLS